jgi:hypothetical protein
VSAWPIFLRRGLRSADGGGARNGTPDRRRVSRHGAQEGPRRSHKPPPTARRLDAPHFRPAGNAGNGLAAMTRAGGANRCPRAWLLSELFQSHRRSMRSHHLGLLRCCYGTPTSEAVSLATAASRGPMDLDPANAIAIIKAAKIEPKMAFACSHRSNVRRSSADSLL